jgi:hypothetical protein
MKSNLIMETYFYGSPEEWRSQIPESIVNIAIDILSINPNETVSPKGYSPVKNLPYQYTLKEKLWDDLVKVIHRWGKPSPTELKTTPAQLKNHVEDLKKQLDSTLSTLRDLEYEPLFKKGTMTKDFIIANRIRQISEVKRHEADSSKPRTFVAALLIKQEYDQRGAWGKYCPFDHELPQAIETLGKILSYVDEVAKNAAQDMKARGVKKKAKNDFENLFYGFCIIYKTYTDKKPIAWNTGTSALNAGQVTGTIIPFLQALLPYTAYKGKLTPAALQKKIMRMKDKPNYKHLWEDSKK